MNPTIAIVGGGLAGIAAAMRLAEADHRPIIIETRKRLGGRATSFVDPRSGMVIDNCQHVVMGCCTNLLDLYQRLGVLDHIEWHRTYNWTAGGGEVDHMSPGWAPAPFHLARSSRRMRLFDRAQHRDIARAMWRIIRTGSRRRIQWRNRTFDEFLGECRQQPETVRRFWSPIVVSACNLAVDRVAADVALQVFQEGFLANRWSSAMGLPVVPLADLYDPAIEVIEQAGGEVRLGVSARSLAFDGRRITGVVTEAGHVEAAAVISSVPFDRLARLATQTLRDADPRLHNLDDFEVSPILGVHLVFDQPIMTLPHLAVVDRGVQWLFNKGVDADNRQHLHAVISAADDWMALAEPEIVERVVADIHHVLPRSVGLQPLEVRAIKEKRATFAATPASHRLRPGVAAGAIGVGGGGVENLFLAGDWCDTGWPATMEGAVRSGYQAAQAITGRPCMIEDVPPGLVARLLGL